MVRASGSYPFGWEFKSLTAYHSFSVDLVLFKDSVLSPWNRLRRDLRVWRSSLGGAADGGDRHPFECGTLSHPSILRAWPLMVPGRRVGSVRVLVRCRTRTEGDKTQYFYSG